MSGGGGGASVMLCRGQSASLSGSRLSTGNRGNWWGLMGAGKRCVPYSWPALKVAGYDGLPAGCWVARLLGG